MQMEDDSPQGLRRSLERESVAALQIPEPVTVPPSTSLRQAIERMRGRRVGYVIVAEAGRVRAILTERDVLTKVLAGEAHLDLPVLAAATPDPEVVSDDCSVAELMRRMARGGYRHMPVVDGSGGLRGVLSTKQIVRYVVECFPASVFNLPPDPIQRQTAREGA